MAPETSQTCGICSTIERISSGNSPNVIAELPRSWLILGDAQFYRGYCLLLCKRHIVEVHMMPRGEVHELLDEMLSVGRTLTELMNPLKLNYECLGNQEPHVHWHIVPRYADDAMRQAPIWVRPEAERKVQLEDSARHQLITQIGRELLRKLPTARIVQR
jgi:diadenosine tetraphosphate (Ap4A) HIT family hydrolase